MKKQPEFELQKAICKWLDYQHPNPQPPATNPI